MAKNVTVIGQEAVMKALKQVSNPEQLFDKNIRTVAQFSYRNLKLGSQTKTPKIKGLATGATASAWKIERKGLSNYEASNDRKTQDKKYFIVDVIEHGHGEIRPKKAKKLYIPLSRKGQSKGYGQPIGKDRKWGVDYVMADKVKQLKGRKFMQKIAKKAESDIVKGIISTIRKVYR